MVRSWHFVLSLGLGGQFAASDINTETTVVGVDDSEIQAGDCIATVMIRSGEKYER